MPNEAELQLAIQVARSGDCDRARSLFIQVLRQDPKNFQAWLWLSEIGKTLEEQTAALERAQALCPPDAEGRRVIQDHLNTIRGAIPLPAQPAPVETPPAAPQASASNLGPMDPFARAERMARLGRREEAIRLLTDLTQTDPQDERTWLLLSELHTDAREKIRLVERVIAINPQHALAHQRLAALQQVQENPLQRGMYLEEAGDFSQAVTLYRLVIAHSRVPTERLEATRRIANIELHRESSQAQPVHPTLNLARVTVGPVLLFVMMVFIQSGLNLFHAPFLAFPGIACVLAGSFLVSVTTMRPMHPKWIEKYGAPGSAEELGARRRLQLAGWLCMLAPFSIFLIEATFRLGALRASMFNGPP